MDIHAALKQATSSLHHRLDHLPMMQQLVSSSLTTPEYAFALTVLGRWFEDIENQFAYYWPDTLGITLKAPLIRQDLAALHASVVVTSDERYPLAINNAFASGVLYVCEGASLGGMIIGPRVRKALQRQDVTHYYSCYGDNTRQHWQGILTYLSDTLTCEQDIKKAIAGAQWAFSSLIKRVETATLHATSRADICLSA
ncbi:MAG TPA: biliverdin-producing heme oxygenase [Pseudomonadales bacterium]|nr:biliverdin-producing heme oxygenase [Pseudomonadales bacterium]